MTDQLLVETAGAVGWITFNNPTKHNALSVAMWRALPEALDRLEADPAIRVIDPAWSRPPVDLNSALPPLMS